MPTFPGGATGTLGPLPLIRATWLGTREQEPGLVSQDIAAAMEPMGEFPAVGA